MDRKYDNNELLNDMAMKLGFVGTRVRDNNLLLNYIADNIGGGSSGLTPEEVEELVKAIAYSKEEADKKFAGVSPYIIQNFTSEESNDAYTYTISTADAQYIFNNKPLVVDLDGYRIYKSTESDDYIGYSTTFSDIKGDMSWSQLGTYLLYVNSDLTSEGYICEPMLADFFVKNDNVKTINGETIIGEGDITVGGSAPYVLGELTPDEDDENVFYLSEEDESYLQNNKPEKIVVSPYVLTNILDESVLPCYQAVSYEGDIKYILTVQSGTFIMAVEEGGGSMPTYDLASMSHEERLQLVADLDADPSLFGRIRVIRNYVKDGIPFVGLCTFYHHYENDKPTFSFACTRSQDVSGETKSAGFFYNYTINDDGTASSNYMRLSDDANLQIEFAKYLRTTGVKTINGESIVGTGNIEIQGGGGSMPTYDIQNMEAQERLQLISDLLADPTLFNRVNIVINSSDEGISDIIKCVHYTANDGDVCYFDFILSFDAGGAIITQALLGTVDTDGEFDLLPNMFGTSKTLDTDGSMDEYLAPTVSAVKEKLNGLSFVSLTQAEYDALDEKDNNTIYFIQ